MHFRFLGVAALAATAALGLSYTHSQSNVQRAPVRAPVSGASRLAQQMVQSIPERSLYNLANQLTLHPPRHIDHVVRRTTPNYPVGHQDRFQILSEDTNHYFQLTATIRARTPHLYLYVENGTDVKAADIQRAADHFENSIYPTDRKFFGSEWTPGVDNDPRITILVADLHSSGIAGYFSAEDEYPRLVNPYSNQREMIYLNSRAILPGDSAFDLTVSHEFQHMIHWHMHAHDNGWLNEGMSMLAEQLNHHDPSGEPSAFIAQPDVQLNSWSSGDSLTGAHYGAAYLYLSYLYDRFGRGFIKDTVAARHFTDFELIQYVLNKRHLHFTTDQLFAQWAVANILQNRSFAGGIYGYKHATQYKITVAKKLTVPFDHQNKVAPYGTQYMTMDALQNQKPFRLTFSGAATVPVVSAPNPVPFWWGNKGDLSDTRLERTVDLRHVRSATLHFSAWYDIEKSYDYGYVDASTDGGKSWVTLRGTDTTRGNPTGANYGNAFTGSSGGWLKETVNLSPYAGHRIKLRFEYITDDVYTGQGFVIKGVSIPQIGFHDNFTGWQAHGFIPIGRNALPSNWIVQLVEYTTHGVVVRKLPVSSQQQGSSLIDPARLGLQKLTVVVFNAVPKTTQQVSYQLSGS